MVGLVIHKSIFADIEDGFIQATMNQQEQLDI